MRPAFPISQEAIVNPSKVLALSLISVCASTLLAAENVTLGNIVVEGDSEEALVQTLSPGESAASQSFTREGIDTFGTQTNMSPLKVINLSPSVTFNAVDAFGSNESSFHDPMRIRGKNQSGPGGVLTLEGLPINGNPGGGKTIYDMENIAFIDLYKGYVPVDKSLGFSNLIGKVDLIVERPKKEAGVTLTQMIGSENTTRTFVRADSGQVGDVRMFGSVSTMQGDKWKGDGDLERTNAMFGLVYRPNAAFSAEFFGVYSDDDHNNYYQMNYSEARDLDTYYDKDYGSNSALAAYADYNRQSFRDIVLAANLVYRISDTSSVTLKPYYLDDKGEYWFDTNPASAANTIVAQWLIDHRLYGGVAEYEQEFSESLKMKLGYWTHRQEPPGPPTNQRKYNVASGTPVFAGYTALAVAEDHVFNSPFAELSGDLGKWSYSAGLRYLDFKLAGLKSYQNGTDATTSTDYDTAIAQGTLDTWSSVDSRTYTEWLPSLMLSYEANSAFELYADYTRSYGYDVNLFPTYVSKRASFVAKNVTLQELWNKQQPELSDNFDLGLKYRIGGIEINPNIFMTLVEGKQVSAYDAQYDVAYPTNNADAKSYGFELSAGGSLSEAFGFMLSGSYNRYYYTDDLQTSATSTASIKGNQIPDAPKYTANAALTYRLGNLKVTPIVRYYSERYGDADNTQKIPSCTLVDVDASLSIPNFWFSDQTVLRLSLTNLFDREYVASIITPDNALAANTSKTSYQSGAPFGAYASVTLKF